MTKKETTTEESLKAELLKMARLREEEGLNEIQPTCKRLNLALIPSINILIDGKPISLVLRAL